MRCREKDREGMDLFASYAARTLSAAEAAALESHIEACEACRARVAAQKDVWAALDLWEPEAISDDFDRRLYARISAEGGRKWWHFLLRPEVSFSFRTAGPVAVACLALVAAFFYRNSGPVLVAPPAPAVSAPRSVDADQVERTLDDLDMLKQMSLPAPGESGSQS